jgi:hypothetical protein
MYQYHQWMAKRRLPCKKVVLKYAFYMYCGQVKRVGLSLSYELGLHGSSWFWKGGLRVLVICKA